MLLDDKMVKLYEQFYLLLNVENYLLTVKLMVDEKKKKKKRKKKVPTCEKMEVKVELDIVVDQM